MIWSIIWYDWTMTNTDNNLSVDDIRAASILDAYRLNFNFYADDDQIFPSLVEFLADPDISNTLTIRFIDDDENSIHIYFDYDTCAINIIALLDNERITALMLSTDAMQYEPMICDRNRRLDNLNATR